MKFFVSYKFNRRGHYEHRHTIVRGYDLDTEDGVKKVIKKLVKEVGSDVSIEMIRKLNDEPLDTTKVLDDVVAVDAFLNISGADFQVEAWDRLKKLIERALTKQ